ncbi:hypothetical protein M2246_005124 [Bacillus sp. LEw-kw-24]|nr:hypothetical protein ACS75_19690 [Bacillus thuringiensis]KXY17158.1 hypothetical protein AT259_21365 [Bacillus cereus]MBG9609886.1 hypothetical protein [Bacillus toyonensis]MDF9889888.1 hypothetical protein [Bacillus sp. LEw-kw-24]MDH6560274.1 hypothetical protein [Bacillus sp. LEw-kw-2]MDH8707398.1 hypothetical protein [Stenotrophomonas sp. 1198]
MEILLTLQLIQVVKIYRLNAVESKIQIRLKTEVYGEENCIDGVNFRLSSSASMCCKNWTAA